MASHQDEHCPARYSPAGQLDDLVWRDLCALLAHPESMAQALERARGGQWCTQELQARRELVHKEYSWARVAERHLAFFERVQDGARPN